MTEVAQKGAVLTANASFYDAFRAGDIVAMDELWSRKARVAVHHPGWPGIDGRAEVMASWVQVMVDAAPPPVVCSDECVILNGGKAVVFCIESFGDTQIIASNIFHLEDGQWRMVHHQATHLPVAAEDPKATG